MPIANIPNTAGPGKIRSFNDGTSPVFEERNFTISGITKDSGGTPIANCAVKLFNSSDVKEQETVSDGSGNYSFVVDKTKAWYVLCYKSGAPDVTGATLNTLQGA